MAATGSDDDEITRWALAAKAGDRTAAGAFIRATQHDVHRFVAHLAGQQEAEDLTQETYLRAMRALPRFAARSSARTWLLAIARRVAADHIRTLVRRPRTADLSEWPGAADAARLGQGTGFEEGVLLDQILRTLPRDRREAFVATQVAGLSYAEAALVCDCPVGTIRSRVARARADLVAAMGVQGGRTTASG
ncbi:sigma-70 family RNA polymerase sigma factor [Micromonospora sp. NPDC050397]|uniref:sigma-70 family RNA polymerase sigma factor n=1 Tax=Micromonospora sp. NPDC050397 TaxID=3364279 RepID=UPI00384E8C56